MKLSSAPLPKSLETCANSCLPEMWRLVPCWQLSTPSARRQSLCSRGMDHAQNIIVLTVFAGSLVAVIVGYLLAWRSERTLSRRAGSLVVAAVAAFAGLLMSAWIIGALMLFPPSNGTSDWAVVGALSLLPLGAFGISAEFIRRAHRVGQRPDSSNRKSPIKWNVKRKVLPSGSMPMFFSWHSAQLIGRRLSFLFSVVSISLS